MKESIGVALYKSMQDITGTDCPVTRLHAFAKAPRLSTLLWRLKYGLDRSVLNETASLIARELPARRFTMRPRVKILSAQKALIEWLNEKCEVCGGRGSMQLEDRVITCQQCGGLGLKRYSDEERGNHSKLIQAAMAVIVRFDSIPGYVMRLELEK